MYLARDIGKRSPAKGWEVEWYETSGVTPEQAAKIDAEDGWHEFYEQRGSTRKCFRSRRDAERLARQILRRGGDAFGCVAVRAYKDGVDEYEPMLAERHYGEEVWLP